MLLSKAKQRAQMLQQYAVDRHVLSQMHELLREHLEATGKFTAVERTAWERDVMVPALARQGFDVTPRIYVEAPKAEQPRLVTLDGGQKALVMPTSKPRGITVEPTLTNPSAFLGH